MMPKISMPACWERFSGAFFEEAPFVDFFDAAAGFFALLFAGVFFFAVLLFALDDPPINHFLSIVLYSEKHDGASIKNDAACGALQNMIN